MTLRTWQLRLSLGIALLTTLAFALPLGYAARQQAADRAQQRSERRAAALVTVLAATRDPGAVRAAWRSTGEDAASTCVRVPGDADVGRCRAPGSALGQASREGRTVRARAVDGQDVLLLPVRLPDGRTAFVESLVREAEKTDGVAAAWTVLAGAVAALTLIAAMGADLITRRLVRSAGELVRAASAVGQGELGVRVPVGGPQEVRKVAAAFNTMTDRIAGLMQSEREFAADLSHRLRTPLTALKLDLDTVEGPAADRLRAAVTALDQQVTHLIGLTRKGSADASPVPGQGTELTTAVGTRMAFWATLARAQGRPCDVTVDSVPVTVDVGEEEVVAALDALLGNVFRHTPMGTRCEVYAGLLDGVPSLVVEDGGPGIPLQEAASVRGHSGGASSGLGLDIAARVAAEAGGRLLVGTSRHGGAQLLLRLGGEQAGPRHRTATGKVPGGASPAGDASF
ncbi:HAMP domain-containing sensor histidine kinase [Streptomyces sp. SID5643]|uniref:sensor histidine kinase n=1 Tax=Streptomyces sp. SID5643 TaxID=2690307 RepID=UPI00137171DF|nr:HAMP domain-containing sensor histidine kinase [Streptomyces sp. SID5643]MZF89469.1 HAMP domain-containing protein [Streptomyces sp. SID5643]